MDYNWSSLDYTKDAHDRGARCVVKQLRGNMSFILAEPAECVLWYLRSIIHLRPRGRILRNAKRSCGNPTA